MVRQEFLAILFAAFIGLLTLLSVTNNTLIMSYEVTDQNNEGVFSSLSRNFDKTLEEINSDDKSESSTDQDSSTNTANTDDELLQNSTLASDPQNSNIAILNSTDTEDLDDIESETPLI
ncbi:MAG TPA: hypothetical protein VJR94_03070 [Candidatus Nitrosocosmicus sp.]|nr:hypothetical protein [Candidatus Nitrosocosmicus sp.]